MSCKQTIRQEIEVRNYSSKFDYHIDSWWRRHGRCWSIPTSYVSISYDLRVIDCPRASWHLEFLGANEFDNRPFIVMPYMKNGNARNYAQANPDCNRLQIVWQSFFCSFESHILPVHRSYIIFRWVSCTFIRKRLFTVTSKRYILLFASSHVHAQTRIILAERAGW